MKKLNIVITIVLLGFFTPHLLAGTGFKIKPAQYYYHKHKDYIESDFSIGLAFESAKYDNRFSMQHNLDLAFNELAPIFRYKLDFRVYLLNDAPDGLYVAPYFNIGGTTKDQGGGIRESYVAYGVGVAPGYQFLFGDDRFSVDAQVAVGMSGLYDIYSGNFPTQTDNDIGFGLIPHVGFGFFW